MIASYAVRLFCLSLAAFLVIHTAAGIAVALAAPRAIQAALRMRARSAARVLFALRLLPAVLSAVVVAGFCIPSYLWLEPEVGAEEIGRLCVSAALAAAAMWCWALANGAAALARSARFTRACERSGAPVLMLAGIFRPRLVLSPAVTGALTAEQLDAVLRHEYAHRQSHDNFRRLVLATTPRLPGFRDLERAWARMSEWAADDESAAGDPVRSLSLASALVRVARLGRPASSATLAVSFCAEPGDLADRVERLLHPRTYAPSRGRGHRRVLMLAGFAAVALLTQSSALEAAHRLLEQLAH
jgi:hypothetical protein